MKVLIMDDSRAVLGHLVGLVKQLSFVSDVYPSLDPAAAVAAAEQAAPDVALLDIAVPQTGGMRNGFDVLLALKRIVPNCVEIMMTLYHEPNYEQQSRKLGAFYLNKVDDFEERLFDVLTQLEQDAHRNKPDAAQTE